MKATRGIATHIDKPVLALSPEVVTDKQLRIELRQFGFGPLLDRYLNHPIFKDEHGTVRWQCDPLMRWLGDRQPSPFNDMWVALDQGMFSVDAVKKFYRDIGYSLGGYLEVFEDDGR